ncbi:MAG: M20/M25/M40 family metallo-hydrolase [Acidobacteriota bacterium]
MRGEIAVLSDRLRPREIDPRHPLVAAASRARHGARLIGTRGVSDWALLDMPAIKVGPGLTERSHTADEFVLESEILEGARFYEALVRELPPGARP